MANYSRGWKSSTSRSNPYFQKRGPWAIIRPSPKRPLWWRFLGGFFSALWRLLKWFLKIRGFWKKIILLGVAVALLGFVFFGLAFAYYSFQLPDPNKLADRVVAESTKIFDRNGKLLYEIHGEAKRTLIKLEDVPEIARQAIIAIEDKNFYKHQGISLTGIIRSALQNFFTGSRVGGSTITQQFVRSAVLTREKTYTRKFKEVVISMQLERRYSKDEILQLYLNEIPFGSNAYGIEAASQTYFGKEAKNLTLLESAYLAALPQAPTYYSPYGPNREELDARADTVLELMYEQGYISKQQRNEAQNQKIEFTRIGRGILAPHFVLYVQDLLAQKYGEMSLQEGGLKVTTTLDLDLQKIAEEAVGNQAAINLQKFSATNAALVAIDPKTGQILAMVGSKDYFNEEHDGAVNVTLRPRQPGSSFKPYVYATAFQKGMSPATMIIDVVTNFGEFGGKDYIPQNYDGKEHGPVSIRQALQGSLNVPAVKTLLLAGIEDSIQTAEKLGITTLKDRSRFGPSLVLGGAEVKLLEHTAGYGVFASGGLRHDPTPILKIEDKHGEILEEFRPSPGREVLNPQIVYQISHVLSDNQARAFIFGRNSRLVLPERPVAAKTGTTQEYRDAWTLGYVPSLVAGVWVGNNDNSSMTGGATGSLSAAVIWNEFMRRALEGKPVEEFVRPPGIVEIAVDSLSGKLPTAYTPSTKVEIFAESFNLPAEYDDVHLQGLNVLRSERPQDPLWEDPVRLWAASHGYAAAPPSDQGEFDANLNLKISLQTQVAELPWKIRVEAEAPEGEKIREIQMFFDNFFLASGSGNVLEYTEDTAHTDGRHQLTVLARTETNKVNQKTLSLEFSLGEKLLLREPRDNQTLGFPVNLVLESSLNVAAENASFFSRSAAGKETAIPGRITKQQIGSSFYYTLNWAETDKPSRGSYALYARIGAEVSPEIAAKIP